MASSAPSRASVSKKANSTMRPPPPRPVPNRAQTATPTLAGRMSPADSIVSTKPRTPKRQTRPDDAANEETNINVVVRCRGRNDREVRENSGVVVSTEGVKGSKVELSMGPSALSNKTYQFDKVFSPAADQGMIFDEVVAPILDEVLAGFNCTIFAYGQTGTGKTYTMSGDITDVLPTPDAAGIIPRVLHWLFDRLGEQGEKCENSVKCSFIELYNEELRDLLAADEGTKLKIFDEAHKNGRTTTLVQGMEESHIKNASKGIQLLREGSHKRQVAATKCNDLSSRSHTVFTITVYMKRTSDTGEDFVSAGKLNLVDLAGSENIQRSGAENKRAAEAGLINKSLLTLGRVINALVERSSHIPYRESKLTRLLQDSLGGQTKTCIIATLSPAKSNLEETISTLDYAFRAKNIRNKPQVNQMVSKKTLLKEFTAEIEKLKSELIATRQRNGVYLTTESYEEITIESESRRILAEEQKDKIETMETNLRNKVQELFVLTTNFQSLKRDNEQTRLMLDGTKSVLEKTEIVLHHTRQDLAEETELRKAHQQTEEKLACVGHDLLGTLGTTTDHVERLHAKLRRRSELQSRNRHKWSDTQAHVAETTEAVEDRIEGLKVQQQSLLDAIMERMKTYVADELRELGSSQNFLSEKEAAFRSSQAEVTTQTAQTRDEMTRVVEEISTLRDDVKQKVGNGLNDLSAAAERIGAGIASELDGFHAQLQDSYVKLGKEFKSIFDGLLRRMNEQQAEVQKLQRQISEANATFVAAGEDSQQQLQQAIEDERRVAACERENLLAKITNLVNESALAQEGRMSGYIEAANKRIKTSADTFQVARQVYGGGMDAWVANSQSLIESSVKSRECVKTKLKADWNKANEQMTSLRETTNAVHGETVRIVDDQVAQMDTQLAALDEIFTRVQKQNVEGHAAHAASLERLANNVHDSYSSIGNHFETSYKRVQAIDAAMQDRTSHLQRSLEDLEADGDIRQALSLLREEATQSSIVEYTSTGETPVKTSYVYPTELPRTEAHENILKRLRGIPEDDNMTATPPSPSKSPSKRSSPTKPTRSSPLKTCSSPSKTPIFADVVPSQHAASAPLSRPATASSNSSANSTSLRELDVNVAALPGCLLANNHSLATSTENPAGKIPSLALPPASTTAGVASLKRNANSAERLQGETKLPTQKRNTRMTVAGLAEGMENVPPLSVASSAALSASVGPGAGGRRLRSRGSD